MKTENGLMSAATYADTVSQQTLERVLLGLQKKQLHGQENLDTKTTKAKNCLSVLLRKITNGIARGRMK